MQQRALLDHLIELIKADYPDDLVRFCHLARIIERDASDDEAARRRLRVFRRYAIAGFSSSLGREVSASNELRKKFVEHFADVFRDHPWTGRAQGTLETRRPEPRQIRAGALRFDPDELVLDKGKLVIVDVRIEPAPAKPGGRHHRCAGSRGKRGRGAGEARASDPRTKEAVPTGWSSPEGPQR